MKTILAAWGSVIVFCVLLAFALPVTSATQAWNGVCLYEVVIDARKPLITIGWSNPPCGPIDIHDTAQHDALRHSWFTPECSLVTIDAHPDNPFPVIEYSPDCSANPTLSPLPNKSTYP